MSAKERAGDTVGIVRRFPNAYEVRRMPVSGMSLKEKLFWVLRRLFRPKKRWYEIDMRGFVKAENARYLGRNEGEG